VHRVIGIDTTDVHLRAAERFASTEHLLLSPVLRARVGRSTRREPAPKGSGGSRLATDAGNFLSARGLKCQRIPQIFGQYQ